ncbi:hypothetical protein CSQ80_01955 [Cyanobacterium aponinum IPPAS B-1201]|nr:hypothetical protein CSQ80_01955 [Cyanobacterium aponinum IPPAS B-1201]
MSNRQRANPPLSPLERGEGKGEELRIKNSEPLIPITTFSSTTNLSTKKEGIKPSRSNKFENRIN